MAQSGEGKPRVSIAGAADAAEASFRSEVVEPMGAGILALIGSCRTDINRSHSGRGAQHGCR
jgi:hypothetical protein